MHRFLSVSIVLTMVFAGCAVCEAETVLYDGSLGTLPGAQGWDYDSIPPGATQTMDGSVAVLNTEADNAIHAGYSQTVAAGLDRMAGYSIIFDVEVTRESHVNNDRAGFSVLALSSDSWGIELGFWTDTIWAQDDDPLFTKAESAAFDTDLGVTTYRLNVSNDAYSLESGGTTILSGLLRNYAANINIPPDPPEYAVYFQQDFLFFGDDTSSAQAEIRLGYIATAPEPSTIVLLAAGAAGWIVWHRRRRRKVSRRG